MAGEGSIYKIKSGRHKGKWAAQISVGKDPESGRPKRKYFYGKTKTEVKEKLQQYKDMMNLGINQEEAKRLTFGEWLAEWLDLIKGLTFEPQLMKIILCTHRIILCRQ